MIKYLGTPAVTFAEFPNEISLVLNISNCPGNCQFCSEPELLEDTGEIVTEELLNTLITKHPGITLIGFMGGDRDHEEICKLADFIHSKNLKVGMYSGQDYLDMNLLNSLDYYKIGHWIRPEGDPDTWWKTNCGPLKFTFSNQIMFKREGNKLINITDRFRKVQINNLQKEVI